MLSCVFFKSREWLYLARKEKKSIINRPKKPSAQHWLTGYLQMRRYLTAAFKNLSCTLKCSWTKEMDVDNWSIRTYVWDLFLCQNLTDAFSTASQALRDSLQSLEYVYKATADLLQLAAFLPLLSSNSLRFILKSNLKHSVLQRLAQSVCWKTRNTD